MRAIDECPPRGEVVQRPTEAAQQPRGSGPLPSTPARARGSSVRATPSLRPPRILGTISLFYRKEDRGKGRLRGRLQLFFLILVWGFPIVAAGILFDVDHLVEACARLRERGLLFECLIVGDGPLRRELAAQIKRSSLESEVHLLGACSGPEVRQHLKRCSVFCLPCVVAEDGDRDGIPVALAEAMALEIPVVSTRVAGVPELVQPEAGLLVSPRDSNGLVEALKALAEDPELRRRLGKRGRGVVAKDFELSAGISRLAKLFARTVEQNSLESQLVS